MVFLRVAARGQQVASIALENDGVVGGRGEAAIERLDRAERRRPFGDGEFITRHAGLRAADPRGAQRGTEPARGKGARAFGRLHHDPLERRTVFVCEPQRERWSRRGAANLRCHAVELATLQRDGHRIPFGVELAVPSVGEDFFGVEEKFERARRTDKKSRSPIDCALDERGRERQGVCQGQRP